MLIGERSPYNLERSATLFTKALTIKDYHTEMCMTNEKFYSRDFFWKEPQYQMSWILLKSMYCSPEAIPNVNTFKSYKTFSISELFSLDVVFKFALTVQGSTFAVLSSFTLWRILLLFWFQIKLLFDLIKDLINVVMWYAESNIPNLVFRL